MSTQQIPEHGDTPPDDSTLAALRGGMASALLARRLLAQGHSITETTRLLRHAYQVLASEQQHEQRRVRDRACHEVVAGLRSGAPDGTIIDTVTSLGLQRRQAQTLVCGARQAIVDARARALVRWLRVCCVALSAVALLMFGAPLARMALTGEPAAASLNAVVLADRLNVRSGPSRSYPVLFTLTAQQPIQVIGRDRSAARLKITLGDQREGWIRSDADAVGVHVATDTLPIVSE